MFLYRVVGTKSSDNGFRRFSVLPLHLSTPARYKHCTAGAGNRTRSPGPALIYTCTVDGTGTTVIEASTLNESRFVVGKRLGSEPQPS